MSFPILKSRVHMNCCILCNTSFCMEKSKTFDDGKAQFATLCKILQVLWIEEHYQPEINPVCAQCTIMMENFLLLQSRIQKLIESLQELKQMLAKKAVFSYKQTATDRKNLSFKRDIYSAWVSKFPEFDENDSQNPQVQPSITPARNTSQNTSDANSLTTPMASPIHHDYNDCDGGDYNGDGSEPTITELGTLAESVSKPNLADGSKQMSSQMGIDHVARLVLSSKLKNTSQTGRQQHCCRTCGKIFATNFSLGTHERLHSGEKPFACSVCDRRFNVKSNRDKHEKTHNPSRKKGEPKFSCDKCGKMHHLETSLQCHLHRHVLGQVRDPSIKLPKRKKKFPASKVTKSRKKAVIISESTSLTEKEKDNHTTSTTTKKRNNVKLGRRLVKKAKSTTIKGTKLPPEQSEMNKTCTECGKIYRSQHELKLHMRIHTGEMPYQCDICLRKFRRPESKVKHVATHKENRLQGEKNLICDICGRGFYLKHSLYNHRKHVHLGVPRYTGKGGPVPCPICGKVLKRPDKLKEHISRHSEANKKFPCSVCGRPFHTVSAAKDHAKNYHNPDKLQRLLFKLKCPACPPEYFGYSSKKKLVGQHWMKCHPDLPVPEELKCRKVISKKSGVWECVECPEGMRPVYSYKDTYQRHYKRYHAGGTGAKKRQFKLTRRNTALLNKSAEVERNESENEDSMMDSTSTLTSEEEDDEIKGKDFKRSPQLRSQSHKAKEETLSSDHQLKELRIVLQQIELNKNACEQYYCLNEFKKTL